MWCLERRTSGKLRDADADLGLSAAEIPLLAPPVDKTDDVILIPVSSLATSADHTMYVNGLVENVTASLLVDTGSCATLLNSKFACNLTQLHHINLNITSSSITLHAVNNSPVQVVGECNVTLSVGKLHAKHQVNVADIGPDVLMGIDFYVSMAAQLVSLLSLCMQAISPLLQRIWRPQNKLYIELNLLNLLLSLRILKLLYLVKFTVVNLNRQSLVSSNFCGQVQCCYGRCAGTTRPLW